ncbi:MAG: DnaJ domain-containing protein [Planctomycetaceae bacterium]|nr:DnaJ domain-containing protein [Planctomycetaceae bacterium]
MPTAPRSMPLPPSGAVPRPAFMRALDLLPPYSVDDVKKAYRTKAARLHPDAGGDPEAFKALHTAYERALNYAQFRESRRQWLGGRIETYAARSRAVEQIEQFGGRCELGPIDQHLEEFGRDFSEVLRELIVVELRGSGITDASLSWIDCLGPAAIEVRTVRIVNSNVTSVGLMRLAALPSIRALDVRGTSVTPDGLLVLDELPGLEWLHIGRTDIGFLARRQLKRKHPRLKVVTKEGESPPVNAHWDEYLTVLRRLERL